MKADSSKLTSYQDNQLVKYSDISQVPNSPIHYYQSRSDGTFYLKREFGISSSVTIDLICEYDSGPDKSFTVTIPSYQILSPSRNYDNGEGSYPLAKSFTSISPSTFTFDNHTYKYTEGLLYNI